MAYEGQIAGVGDGIPGKPLRSAAIRFMQARSERDIRERLPRIVEAVREVAADGGELEFVNGGGTGSLARTAAAGIVTELTAGSGFYAPALFDNYRSLDARAGRVLLPPGRPPPGRRGRDPARRRLPRLRRRPATTGCPSPTCPAGLRFDRQEGAGEVQTPVPGAAAYKLRVGDRVYLRHAKAGELCERFDSLYLVEGERIVDEVPTYRGEGKAFL